MTGEAACSAAWRCAFSIISSCFFLSFARIGTRSEGTGVLSLKFLEKPRRSLSLTFLSCITLCRRSSATRIFCFSENCLKAFKVSFSTLPVGLVVGAGAFAGCEVVASSVTACFVADAEALFELSCFSFSGVSSVV